MKEGQVAEGDDEEQATEYTQIFGSSSNNTYSRIPLATARHTRYQDDTLGAYRRFFSRRGDQGLFECGQCLRVKDSTQLCKLDHNLGIAAGVQPHDFKCVDTRTDSAY